MTKRLLSLLLFLGVYLVIFIFRGIHFLNLPGLWPLYLQLLAYTGLALWGIWIFREIFASYAKQLVSNPKKSLKLFFLGCLSNYGGAILGGLLATLIYALSGLEMSELQNQTNVANTLDYIPLFVAILVLGILGPLVEEMIYRKIIMDKLSLKLPIFLVLPLQALVFALIHVHQLEVTEFINVLPHFMMGLVLGYIYYKTENLFYSSAIHSVNNIVAILATVYLL